MSEVAGRIHEDERTLPRLRRAKADGPLDRVAFPDLARAHHAWNGSQENERAAQAYAEALLRFERAEGRVENAHWCTRRIGGAAVTHLGRRRRFHRATFVQPQHDVATLLNECDELGVRISEVLRGTGQRIAIGLVLRTAANLLAHADNDDATPELLEHEADNLADAQAYYRRAARRQAQLIFVGGMLLGILALCALVWGILAIVHVSANVEWIARGAGSAGDVSLSNLYLCAISGALGAAVSTASRIDENTFAVDYELGRFTIVSLGAMRPLLGAVFGIALYSALVSGLLDLFAIPQDDTKQLFFFLVVAFVAGFSERWAKGVLMGVGTKDSSPSRRAS